MLNDRIKEDFKWLKSEIEALTYEERCIMLDEYADAVGDYGIGVKEYQAFIMFLNELEE